MPSSSQASAWARPLSAAAWSRSISTTSIPAVAATVAMPAPIIPGPENAELPDALVGKIGM